MSSTDYDVRNPLAGRAGFDRAEYGDGQFETGFFGAGENAWHGLGTVIPEDVVTADRALELAGLDWLVERKALFTTDQRVPDYVANVRSSDGSVLGVVSDTYQVVQNHEGFAFVDDLLDDSGAKFHTAGSLRNGKHVWMLARLPETIKIAGWDDEAIDPFLLFSNAHDGSASVTTAATPIRVVCRNTLSLAIGTTPHKWSVRHSRNVKGRLQEARRALGLAHQYFGEFEQLGNTLVNQKFDQADFERFLRKLVPVDDDMTEKRQANVKEVRLDLLGAWRAPNLDNVRETRWGALQAVAEYADYGRTIRGKENCEERAWRRAMDDGTGLKRRALALVQTTNDFRDFE